MYQVPIQTMLTVNDNRAGFDRLRARDRALQLRNYRNTDPGRGPVIGAPPGRTGGFRL